MARQFIPIDKVADQGLAEDQPSTSKIWKTLKNVRRAKGWRRRPGTKRIGTSLPTGNDPGLPKLFTMFKNKDSVAGSEILRPTTVGFYDVWTVTGADAALALDEAVADDTDFIETTTKGNKTSVVVGTLVGTFSSVSTLRIFCRVLRHATITNRIKVHARIASVDHLLGTLTIDAGTGLAGVTIDSSLNPATSLPWLPAAVSGMEIVFEKDEGDKAQTEEATASNVTNSWLVVGDGNLNTADGDTGGRKSNGLFVSGVRRSRTNSPYLQRTFAATALTWKTIKSFAVIQFKATTTKALNIWNGSTLITAIDPGTGAQTAYSVAEHEAWWIGTAAGSYEVAAGSSDEQFVSQMILERRGTAVDDTAAVRITQAYITVEGDGGNAIKNVLILASSKGFFRVSEDLTTYTDIIGTAATPTASEGTSWDQATFLGQLYLVNGKDQIFTYPTASAFAQFSSKPTGATVAAYGDRLVLGDVLESGVREQARVRYSAYLNGANWTDASSGNFELNETPGKIVKLKPLVEQSQSLTGVLVAYKTMGIYHLTPTVIANAPFAKKLMDGSAGCLARGSVVGVSDASGRESHVFLGTVGGTVTVLSWNGAAIAQIGTPITDKLAELGDLVNLEKSFSVVDTFGNYIMVFPTTGGGFLKTALVYNFAHQVWTTWDLNNVTALGTWQPNTGGPVTVLGRPDGLAYYFDDTLSTDAIEGGSTIVSSEITIGDIAFGDIWQERTLERVWVFYEEGAVEAIWDVDVSIDGGATYRAGEVETSATATFQGSANKRVLFSRADARITGRKHSVRMQSTRDDGKPTILQLVFEFEPAGILP